MNNSDIKKINNISKKITPLPQMTRAELSLSQFSARNRRIFTINCPLDLNEYEFSAPILSLEAILEAKFYPERNIVRLIVRGRDGGEQLQWKIIRIALDTPVYHALSNLHYLGTVDSWVYFVAPVE